MMPVSSSSIAVGTSAVKVSDAKVVFSQTNRGYDPNLMSKFVYVQDGGYDSSTEVYVGGSNVTVANGVKVSKINVTVFQLHEDDELYAIASDTDGELRLTEVL
jgi:hypothetical protein